MKTVTIPRALQDWLKAPRSIEWHEQNPGSGNRALPNVVGETRHRISVAVGPQEREVILRYCDEALEDEGLSDAKRGAIEHTRALIDDLQV